MPLHFLRLLLRFAAFAWGMSNSRGNDSVSHEAISVQAPFAMPAIVVPVFPSRAFVVTNFGAVEGGAISEAIRGTHMKNVTVEETGSTPFKIAGDARLPVQDVFLEDITIQKAHGAAKSFKNAENIH